MKNWENITNERFVLFADILGFKDLVNSNKHEDIVEKLEKISDTIDFISGERSHSVIKNRIPNLQDDQSKAISFSDSIVVFSKGNTNIDASKIIADAHVIMHHALETSIPIKAALSFGKMTVDFEKSLFFGQPLIDAYLLHEDLSLLSVIIDNKAERQIASFSEEVYNSDNIICDYEVPMKFGKVNHKLIRPSSSTLDERIDGLKALYLNTSGKPRIYLDNTLKFWESLKQQ
jgi:hypothetical protein